MGYYLQSRTTRLQQYRAPRREEPSGVIVVHTAENTPDWVAFDGGAEAVANFIADRADYGSYHTLCDSDSFIRMVAPWNEAFGDATDHGNWHEFHISAATRADVWPLAPSEWRAGCVKNMAIAAAEYQAWLMAERGISIPGIRISRAQSQERQPGFISHAERDPTRRTDPGRHFPWIEFFHHYIQLTGPTIPARPDEENPEMVIVQRGGDGPAILLVGDKTYDLVSTDDLIAFRNKGIPHVKVSSKQWTEIAG